MKQSVRPGFAAEYCSSINVALSSNLSSIGEVAGRVNHLGGDDVSLRSKSGSCLMVTETGIGAQHGNGLSRILQDRDWFGEMDAPDAHFLLFLFFSFCFSV